MNSNESEQQFLLVDSSLKIEQIKDILDKNELKIITFDYYSHKLLSKNNISHQISDNYIDEADLDHIQQISYKLPKWFELNEIKKLQEYNGVNLGDLFRIEFYLFLLPFLKKLVEIKKITELYNKSKFITSGILYEITKSFNKYTKAIDANNSSNKFVYDSITLENNFMKIKISRNSYLIIKIFLDKIINFLFRPNVNHHPNILLVEFNTILYEKLFSSFKNTKINQIFYGRRRPAIWNFKSYSIIRKSNCKIATPYEVESRHLKTQITNGITITKSNFDMLLNNDNLLRSFFQINDSTFWHIIKPYFASLYDKHIKESIEDIEITKKILEKFKPKHVLILSESGKTEQIVISLAKQLEIPILLLQHGLGHDNKKGHDYNHFTGSVLVNSDKFIVWGDAMQLYAKEYGLPIQKVKTIGSIVHDQTFELLKKNQNLKEDFVLLVAQGPLNMHVRDHTIKANEDYEKIIKTICKVISNNKKKLIIKLHPFEDDNNEPEIAKEIDPSIQVLKKANTLSLIASCSFMISVSTSISNVILDAHILKKPVIRIPFGEWMGEPDRLRPSSCFNILLDNFESVLIKLYDDENFRNHLIEEGTKFVDACLKNKGSTSEELMQFLET